MTGNNAMNNEAMENYKKEITRVLNKFSTAKEWSDFIGLLTMVETVIKKYNNENIRLTLVHLPQIIKRLQQCLNPVLPNGVHIKTIDLYKTILKVCVFNKESTLVNTSEEQMDFISKNFYLLFKPLFGFGEYCRILVLKHYLDVIERFIIPLYNKNPKLPLKLILQGILPSLESETADNFEQGYKLVEALCGIFKESRENKQTKNVLSCSFYMQLYRVFIENENMRLFILNFINKHKACDMPETIDSYIVQTKVYCLAMESDVLFVSRYAFEKTSHKFPLYITSEQEEEASEGVTPGSVEDKLGIRASEIPKDSQISLTTDQTTFNVKKQKVFVLTKNVLFDKEKEILEKLNTELKLCAFKIFCKKESSLVKKFIKWFDADTNHDDMINNFILVLKCDKKTSHKLEIFVGAMQMLFERLPVEFLNAFLKKYICVVLFLLKSHVENILKKDKMPLKDIKGIHLLKILKIFLSSISSIFGHSLFELTEEIFSAKEEKHDFVKSSKTKDDKTKLGENKDLMSNDKNKNVLDSSENILIEKNSIELSLNTFVELVSFTITVLRGFNDEFYITEMFKLTEIIFKNKTKINPDVFCDFMDVFYKVLIEEELIIEKASHDGYYTYIEPKYIDLLAKNVFDIKNYRSDELSTNKKLEKENLPKSNTFFFSERDLNFIAKFHETFIKNTCFKNKEDTKNKEEAQEYVFKVPEDFQNILDNFILHDYSNEYIITNVFKSPEKLQEVLIKNFKSFNGAVHLLKYFNKEFLKKYLVDSLEKGNENSSILSLLETNANNPMLTDSILFFCYYIHRCKYATESKFYNSYSYILQSIKNWNDFVDQLINDMELFLSENKETEVFVAVKLLSDLISNFNMLVFLKSDAKKPYASERKPIQTRIDNVLQEILGKYCPVEGLSDESDKSELLNRLQLIFTCYYEMNRNGFTYNVKNSELYVEKFKNDIKFVKHCLYTLDMDYIQNKLLEYYKMILFEISKKNIYTKEKTKEFLNRLVLLTNKYANNNTVFELSSKLKETNVKEHEEVLQKDHNIHKINIISVWREVFSSISTSILNQMNLKELYNKLVFYFINYALKNVDLTFLNMHVSFTKNFSKVEISEKNMNNMELHEIKVKGTCKEKNFVTKNLFRQVVAYDDYLKANGEIKEIAQFSFYLYRFNPKLFVSALPSDNSVLPLFLSFNDAFKAQIFTDFVGKYSSYTLFMMHSDFEINSTQLSKSFFKGKLSETDILTLLNINMKQLDSSCFSIVSSSTENMLSLNVFKMLYCAVLNNSQFFEKFKTFMYKRVKKNKEIFKMIDTIIRTNEELEKDVSYHEDTLTMLENNSAIDMNQELEFNTTKSHKTNNLMHLMIEHIYTYHRNSFIFYERRKSLSIAFADELSNFLLSSSFFKFNIEEKAKIYTQLSSYIDFNKTLAVLMNGLIGSFFGSDEVTKIFNLKRLSFLIFTSCSHLDGKYMDQICVAIRNLFSKDEHVLVEIYRLIKVLLLRTKNITALLLLYPLIVENMLNIIESGNTRLLFSILSTIDVALFLNIGVFDLKGILDDFVKKNNSETNSFSTTSVNYDMIEDKLIGQEESKKILPFFTYKEKTKEMMFRYAFNAPKYYKQNNLVFKERDYCELEKLIVEQFLED
ncbi:pad-1 [Ecytonucleospora hepatopenaei]|uniref:Pad-1 n=1 Tax=Ecytonucleospora hepatopenaei TaxID=646526 RepID=A0A1W0E4Z8_9MICR|nr:pad-1 [Ecytonucleospora hepatopenaei]